MTALTFRAVRTVDDAKFGHFFEERSYSRITQFQTAPPEALFVGPRRIVDYPHHAQFGAHVVADRP
jgi:hypothetical protein